MNNENGHWITVRGKGGKYRRVFVSEDIIDKQEREIKERELQTKEMTLNNSINFKFTNNNDFDSSMFYEQYEGKGLSVNAARQLWIALKREYTDYLNKHNLRETYSEVYEYIMDRGRGLGNATNLSQYQKHILELMDKVAMPSTQPLTLYRTDTTEWLSSANVGDAVPIKNVLFTSLNEKHIIDENRGNVRQRIVVNAPIGTRMVHEGESYDLQEDIVRGQSLRVDGKYFDDAGIPVYVVTIIKDKGESK